ncbi:MAG: hypothetical protein M1419_00545, partial [Bacteroidetes bacterium]|nr:hypothetical protein [Bacteroidota bacterium]
ITQDGPTGDYTIQIPNINKFPMNGYYQFFAHIDLVATWEWNSYNGVPNTSELYKTILVQLIDSDGTQPKIKTPNHINTLGLKPGCPAECCCTISGNHNHYWIDVQGFAHINSPDCTGRYFSLKVIKPTGALITTWDITFCTWEVHYLGRKKAAYCNPPV